MTSIRDISAATKLSVATVSRALRNDPKVSQATRESVLLTAKKMGYTVNPYVGQMMSSLRRSQGSTFRGNMAIVWKNSLSSLSNDARLQQSMCGARTRAKELGYLLDEFDIASYKPEALERVIYNRGIQGIMFFMPAYVGAKVRVRMNLDHFACVSLGWGLWLPHLDSVKADYYQLIRLALHHARHEFKDKIAAIWDMKTDRAAHNAGSASFLIHHPGGPAVASELFFSRHHLTERAFAKAAKKHGLRCLLLSSSFTPPDWLSKYVPEQNWIWFCDPGAVPHYGRIDVQNDLVGRWGVDLLAAKIQMSNFGVPSQCQSVLVPPRWVRGK